jgi:hypothetical protein
MPENESGSTAHDRDCSLNSCESFAWFDRDSWSWKTSQRCLVEGWATYSESFPRAGTMRNGIAYRRQASAPLTGGTGCLSSGHNVPTPTKSDAQRMPNTGRNSHGPTIHEIAEQAIPIRTWPTPHGMSPDGRSHGPSGNELGRAVNRAMWPTPTKEDSRGGVSQTPGGARATGLNATVRMWGTPKAQDARCAKRDRGRGNMGEQVYGSVDMTNGGSLNPTWVEWLMGFPPEWTALSASETPSSLRSRKSSGGESGS